MTSSLRRVGSQSSNAHRFVFSQLISRFSTDALSVEYKAGEIGTVSGIPDEHLQRRVLIYSPARTASQQGAGKVGKWKINFLSTQKWENPLMGWTSTGDPYANVGDSALSFETEADAKAFAERHGWNYTTRAYADNFKWKGLPETPANCLINQTRSCVTRIALLMFGFKKQRIILL